MGLTENENYSYPNPYDQECVSSVIYKQKSKNINLIDVDFLDKVSKMYLHEAVSVLRIRYYYSFAVLDTFNQTPTPKRNQKN